MFFELRIALLQPPEEPDRRDLTQPPVQDVGDLGEDRERHDRGTAVVAEGPGGFAVANVRPVHERDDRRGVEGDHASAGAAARPRSAASVTGPFFQDPTQPGSS